MKTITVFILCVLLAFNCTAQGIDLFAGGTWGGTRISYTKSTIVFSATNATFTTMNIIKMKGEDKHKSNAGFGLVLGASQIFYGATYKNSKENNVKTLMTINVALGLATILTSTVRLIRKKPAQEQKIGLSFSCLPNVERKTLTVGVGIAKCF